MLPNISRNTDNQPIEFGQLIKCNMRNFFPEKSCANYGRETSPKPFSKKSKLSVSLDH